MNSNICNDNRPYYHDIEAIDDDSFFDNKQIVIYGAGNIGRKAIKLLQSIRITNMIFCDSDNNKKGNIIEGIEVFSLEDLRKSNEILVIIIAIESLTSQKEVESLFKKWEGRSNIQFVSLFTIECIGKWKYTDYDTYVSKLDVLRDFYRVATVHFEQTVKALNSDILVYQAGKVASWAVHTSLIKCGINSSHVHYLFDSWIKNEYGMILQDVLVSDLASFLCSASYRTNVVNQLKNKKIVVIVRDPIANALSRVFQYLGANRLVANKLISEGLKTKSIVQVLVDECLRDKNQMFKWFDDEFKQACGFSVFDYSFDKQEGYTIIRNNNVEVLLMKMEKLQSLKNVIGNFVCADFELIHNNVGEVKAYKILYSLVKNRIYFPEEQLDFIYNNNYYMDYFYTEEEQMSFRKKWSVKIKQ